MALMLAALIIMPAAFLYLAVKMGLTPLNAVCLALLSATACSTGTWFIINGPYAGKDMFKPFEEEFKKQLVVVEEQMKAQNQEGVDSKEVIDTLRENFDNVAEMSRPLVPSAVFFMWHLVSLIALYYFVAWLAPKIGFNNIKPFPPFKDWCFDWNLIWIYIAGWTLYFLVGRIEGLPGTEAFRVIGANCFMVSSFLYLIAGFSLLFFFFDKYKIGLITRVGLSLIALIFAQFLIWLGIIDVWAQLRTRKLIPQVTDDSDDNY